MLVTEIAPDIDCFSTLADECHRPGRSALSPPQTIGDTVIIVAGHIVVDAHDRESYLASCVDVVEQARAATGCLDFVIAADLVDPARVHVFERWDSRAAVEAFRGSGPDGGQAAMIVAASVSEYEISSERSLN
ncbi:conserved hypothetical protein [Rhodococcus sp. RD6.2]|nr:conserved hypothetical protein [Rhodococcus sp. RD6.2]